MPAQKFTVAEIQSLYLRHGSALAAYACCSGLDFALAEDVVQQVFLKLLRADGAAPRFPLAYVYRAVRNASLNLLRNRWHETELPEDERWLVHSSGANSEDALLLQKGLRELPPEQQETVFLRIWSGMTLQEIALATDTPLNTVASRYRYALERLRVILK